MSQTINTNDKDWQQQTIERLALSSLKEQKASRRWGIFFKLLTFAYLAVVLGLSAGWLDKEVSAVSGEHTALIDLVGIISPDGELNAHTVMDGLSKAFENKGTKGVLLRINSPGGSPVQAGIINAEIQRQKKLHPEIPVYAVVEDICASGGYYVAAAADKIFVDKASIVGSIGVLMDGYGFTGVMEKIGIERRLMTAGENKAMLDPFSPLNPAHQVYAQNMLNEIHEQFKQAVREGRGNRLNETADTFSGLFWSGEQSIKIGLADTLGTVDYVAREVIGQEDIVDFTYRETFADRFAKKLGASIAKTIGIDVVTKGVKLR